MRYLLISIAAASALGVAFYAHRYLRAHVVGSARLAFLHVFLLMTGVIFGYAAASIYAGGDRLYFALAFLAAFGLVHVPAAVILFIKGERSEP